MRAEWAPLRLEADDGEGEVHVAHERFETKHIASDTDPHQAEAFPAAERADVRKLKLEGGVADDRLLHHDLDRGAASSQALRRGT